MEAAKLSGFLFVMTKWLLKAILQYWVITTSTVAISLHKGQGGYLCNDGGPSHTCPAKSHNALCCPDKREAAAARSACSSGRKIHTQQQYCGVSSVLSSLCSVQFAMETFNAKHTQP